MFFYISKIAAPFTDPLLIIFVILVLSALLYRSGRGRWAGRCLGVAIGLMIVVLFTPADIWLLRPLEDRFPIPAAPACLDGIVVLSGGEAPGESVRRGVPLLEGTPMRYVVLSDLMRRYPRAKVIFSGGSGSIAVYPMSEGDIAREVMAELRFDMSRIRFESKSRNTWENAVFSKELAHPQPNERWALLAPALQMPRAIGSFRKIGWDVLPWPTDYTGITSSWWPQVPSRRLTAIGAGEHQWLGLFFYWLTGRSSELFPGPSTGASQDASCSPGR